jgi:hypothetical protein
MVGHGGSDMLELEISPSRNSASPGRQYPHTPPGHQPRNSVKLLVIRACPERPHRREALVACRDGTGVGTTSSEEGFLIGKEARPWREHLWLAVEVTPSGYAQANCGGFFCHGDDGLLPLGFVFSVTGRGGWLHGALGFHGKVSVFIPAAQAGWRSRHR